MSDRQPVHVLNLCDNDEIRYLWKHAWMTNRKSIESSLKKNGISIMADQAYDPIARPMEQVAENFDVIIIRTFYEIVVQEKSYTKQIFLHDMHVTTEEVDRILKTLLDAGVGIYRDKDKHCLWFVGSETRVDEVVKTFEGKAKMCSEKEMFGQPKEEVDARSFESSFEHVMEPVYVQLTPEQMAIMWIYDLFGIECLSNENVNIKNHKFDVTISVPNLQEKAVIEEQIREKTNSKMYTVQTKCLRFSPQECDFLTRNEIHLYIKSKVNRIKNKIDCVWFKGDQNTVTLYSEFLVETKCDLFRKCIKDDIVPVPWRHFRLEETQQKIKGIEKQFNGKVSLELSPSYDTITVLFTSDLWQVEQEIKKMFTTKSLEIQQDKRDSCKFLFPKFKESIEHEFSVNIEEPDAKKRYGWIIKGGETSVTRAYSALYKLKETIRTETKTYITEECINIAQSKVNAINEKSICHVSLLPDRVASNTRGNNQKTTDLREQVSCRSLKMKDGYHVTIFCANLNKNAWLRQDCLAVNVLPFEGQNSSLNIRNTDEEHCFQGTAYLPVWNDGKSKEKENLESVIKGIVSFLESCRNSVQTVAFDLEGVEIVNWPKTKYLKCILGSLRGNKPLVNLHFYTAPENYQIVSDIINKWSITESGQSEPRVKITILKEELAKVKCDALVNSTSGDLKLDRGIVSNSLLKAGGDELQFECNRYLSSQNTQSINYTDVIVTNGHRLPSKYVFHGVLPGFKTNQSHCFDSFIENCLKQANIMNLQTIAFPALGTGQLAYPHKIVAEKMMNTVQQFIMKNQNGSLVHVYFVIFPSDYKSIQAFEDKEKDMRSKEIVWNDSFAASPSVSCNVQVIGQCNQDIQSTFQEIENSLRETEREVSRGDIYIPPSSTFVEPEKQEILNREGQTDTSDNIQNISKDARRETAADIDNIGSSDNTFLPPQESYTSEDQSVRQRSTCHVEVVLQAGQNGDPWNQFEKTFRLFNIKSDQIVWNPATAMKARLKFKSEYEANVFIKKMENERIFQVQMSSIDAVVNIRAKLNKKMDKYLQREENQLLLSKHSGVFIDCLNGETTLFGDLMEISTARDILLSWEKEENKAESSCQFQKDEFEKHHVNNKPENPSEETSFGKTLKTPSKDTVISDTSYTSERNVIQENGNLKMQVFTDDRNALPARQSNIGDIKSAEKKHGIGGLKPKQGMVSQTQTSSPSRVDTQNHHSNNSASMLDPKFQQQNMQGTKPGLYPKLNESKNNSLECDEKSTGAIRKYSKQTDENGTGSTMKSEGADRYHPLTQQIKQNAYNYKDEKHNIAGTSDQYNQSLFKPEDDSLMMETKEGVKVFVYKADICYLDNVDCIVNSSNSGMNHSMGLSEVIAKRAGKTMEDECKTYLREFGTLSSDSICITSAGNLSHYKRIVHVNAPNAKLNLKPEEFSVALSSSVKNCLNQANKDRMTSCAFPAVSSGHGGIPKDVCYSSYPAGVIRFSRKLKKPTVKEVHFVDRDQDVVDLMQAAFLNAVREGNEHSKGWKDKWFKIPQKTKDLFKSHIRDESQAGKYLELHLDNKTVVIVCDGGLLNSLKHPHVENVTRSVGYGQWKRQETVLVIAEDVDFSGKSQTAQKCLKRGGKSFGQNYNSVKTTQRKKIGSVLESYAANNMDIFNVLFSILPKFSNSAKVKYSSEQTTFFELLYNSFLNILLAADKSGYKHLSTPLFCADFYNNSDEWFMVRSTRDMLSAVRTFAKSRQGKGFMVVHIVTDGNDKLFQILNEQMREISV